MHTVSLAPSIKALVGAPWILRPQTSHRNDFSPSCLYYKVVFIVVELKMQNTGGKHVGNALSRIRSTADYQFGKGVGVKLFPENVDIEYSKATGRIRYVYLNGKRLATLRPTDGLLSLSITAAQTVAENRGVAKGFVTVQNDVSKFIADGGDVFAVHVVAVDEEVRAKDEVVIVDEDHCVLAVGRALLSSIEMKAFKTGVAVKVRRGSAKES
jgi:predicted RNA-binding protein (TIGR00451 family)